MSVDAVLARAEEGGRIGLDDALLLLAEAPLPELGWAADRVCERKHPGGVRTYVIDRNVNYTNICVSGCAFCAFYREPGDPEGYVLPDEVVLEKVEEAVDLGATQILMQGGLHPDLRIDYFEALLGKIKARFSVQLHCLSAPEIAHIARTSGLTVRDTLLRLRDAGLDSLPGGGAEMLVDEVRRRVSPHKCSVDEWLDVMRQAASIGMRATATMVFGMGETLAQRVEHLSRIRDLQDETGIFTAFIPWTYQPGNTTLGGDAVGGHDYLRTLAVSRLFLDNIENLQASWVTQGMGIAQLALRFGANDVGSTMIEENVVAATGVKHRTNEAELVDLINSAGYTASQRTTMYNIVKVHGRNLVSDSRYATHNP
jgi:cyclic dehypoxanthinyl futalosine synthase